MKEESYSYRIFVCYARDDRAIADSLIEKLENLEASTGKTYLDVYWDGIISAGTPFSDVIKDYIAQSHIFIALITSKSIDRAWVHQEAGYAVAKEIPVLVMKVSDKVANDAQKDNKDQELGMLASLQSIQMNEDFEGLENALSPQVLEGLVLPSSPLPPSLIDFAEWPEKRTELLVKYATRELRLRNHGVVRQKATFSSFHLPEFTKPSEKWDEQDSETEKKRSGYYRYLLSEERRVLEQHALVKGCKLIIAPLIDYHFIGPPAVKARRRELVDFLESFESKTSEDLEVVISTASIGSNITIIGDWFSAVSHKPTRGGFRHTMFDFHPLRVKDQIREFDVEFKRWEIMNEKDRGKKRQLDYVISKIQDFIDD